MPAELHGDDAAAAAGYTEGGNATNKLICWTIDRGDLPVAACANEGEASAAFDSTGPLRPAGISGTNDTHADHLA